MVQQGTDERDRPDPRRTSIEEPDRDGPEREDPEQERTPGNDVEREDVLDPVEEADEESFPASDPPPGPGSIG